MTATIVNGEERDFQTEKFVTLQVLWPWTWPWIWWHNILSCYFIYRISTYPKISFELKKLFVDKCMDRTALLGRLSTQ